MKLPADAVRLGLLAAIVVLAGCAGTPSREPTAKDWGMVPTARAARGPTAELMAGPVAQEAPSIETAPVDPAQTLVSLPVPTDTSPLAGLANLFDRIRLGYALPETADKSVALQARYFAGMPDYLDRAFERGERYLYYVVRELEARNMPLELAMLPIVESAYNPYAFSRARAAGIWQFIAPTATRYQVRVNWWQDGRRDVVDSTRAALDYLSALHTMFDGDWFKAIAAYNCGELAVVRAVERNRRAGKPTDFFHLKLPRETRAYVPKLLALSRIVANPSAYGLEFASLANLPYFAQVEVGSQLDLRVAAALIDVGEEELHALNPAFNRWATDPEGPHHLLVPYAAAPTFARAIAGIAPETRMPVEHYRLRTGDTLATVAAARDLSVPAIRELNGATRTELRVGDDILLPLSRIAPLRAGLIIEGETPLPGHHRKTYVVRRGDTLASIARQNRVRLAELAHLNGLEPQAQLTAGMRLLVEVQDKVKRRRHKVSRAAHSANGTAAARRAG
jgi:membrane-bound lytic murein transglycosylase D